MTQEKYRLPAEWEKHQSTILCWPHQKADWPGKFIPILWVYAEIVKNIAAYGELVRIIAQSQKEQLKIVKILERAHVNMASVEFVIMETDRGWMRDSSPIFVKSQKDTIALQFKFNGWAKYDNWTRDQFIPKNLAKHLKLDLVKANHKNRHMVLEGGAIDSNGCGTLLTTKECLLDEKTQTRNPGFTKSDYEAAFAEYFGIKNVIWLNKGIVGDDTHGHVDDLCRFVNKNTIVICCEENSKDENYHILQENIEILKSSRLEDGSKINIVTLPMPKPLHFEDLRLPASYANFYISNKVVLVPTFNDVNDRVALNIIKECFPDRDVVGIHAVDLVWGLGTLHCLTHEQPA